jgi:hypothetical protein
MSPSRPAAAASGTSDASPAVGDAIYLILRAALIGFASLPFFLAAIKTELPVRKYQERQAHARNHHGRPYIHHIHGHVDAAVLRNTDYFSDLSA